MYRLRISKRLPGGKYEHRYSKEYQSVQQLFAKPAFADYLQKNVGITMIVRVIVAVGGFIVQIMIQRNLNIVRGF